VTNIPNGKCQIQTKMMQVENQVKALTQQFKALQQVFKVPSVGFQTGQILSKSVQDKIHYSTIKKGLKFFETQCSTRQVNLCGTVSECTIATM